MPASGTPPDRRPSRSRSWRRFAALVRREPESDVSLRARPSPASVRPSGPGRTPGARRHRPFDPICRNVRLIPHERQHAEGELLVHGVVLDEQDPQRMPRRLLGVELGEALAPSRRSGGTVSAAARVTSVKWNALPRPGTPSLSAHIVPPISSASQFRDSEAEARARVPPTDRDVGLAEGLEQAVDPVRRDPDAGIADDHVQLDVPVFPCLRCTHGKRDASFSVNFTALLGTLSRIWRSRPTSPRIVWGTPSSISDTSRGPCRATEPMSASTPSTQARKSNGAISSSTVPPRPSRVEDVVDDREERFAARTDESPRTRAPRRARCAVGLRSCR